MNRLSVIAVLIFAFTFSLFAGKADEKKLLALVPSAADGVLSVDLSAWLSLPSVKKGLAESPEVSILKKRTGIAPEDIGALVLWGQGEYWTLLVSAKKPFNPEKFFRAPEYICRKNIIDGAALYTVTSSKPAAASKKRKRPKQESFCVTVLSNNTAAFFKDPVQAAASMKLMKGKTGFAFPSNISGDIRGLIGRCQGFEKAVLSCSMTGAAKDIFSGTFRVTLPTAQQAQEMQGQAMLMLNLLMIQGMKDAPELAADLMKQLNFSVDAKDIVLKAELPAALLERLSKYAAQKKVSRKSAKSKSAPKKKLPQSTK